MEVVAVAAAVHQGCIVAVANPTANLVGCLDREVEAVALERGAQTAGESGDSALAQVDQRSLRVGIDNLAAALVDDVGQCARAGDYVAVFVIFLVDANVVVVVVHGATRSLVDAKVLIA